ECGAALRARDYTIVWEEHVLYFTPRTFRALFETAGFATLGFHSYPYDFEDSLVLIAEATNRHKKSMRSNAVAREINGFATFTADFAKIKRAIRSILMSLADGAPAFIYGAGHLAASFVNY